MSRTNTLRWYEVHPPRPLGADTLTGALTTVAAHKRSPIMVFETRTKMHRVSHLLGVSAGADFVARSLRDLVPGLQLVAAPNLAPTTQTDTGQIRIKPRGSGLAVTDPELVSQALFSAIHTGLGSDEELVVQIVLGPSLVPGTSAYDNPSQGQSLADRRASFAFDCTVRLGAKTANRHRAGHLLLGIFGALTIARAPGTRIDLVRQSPKRLDSAGAPWVWPLRLTCTEVAGWLAWPLGHRELAGVAPLHPKQLPVPIEADRSRLCACGTAPGSQRPFGISTNDALQHTVVLGPTGSGKSTAMTHLIEADLRAGLPMVVIDPKCDLVEAILDRIPQARRDDVVILDPLDQQPVGFNPLDASHKRPEVVADSIVAVLRHVFADGWGPRTEDLFYCSLLTLTIAGQHHQHPYTLADLPRLFTTPSFRSQVVGTVGGDIMLESFWGSFEALSTPAQAQILAAPMNKLRQYLRPQLLKILGQTRPGFKIDQLFTQRRVLLVPLNEGLIGPITADLLGSLLIGQLWQTILARANEHQPVNRPAMIYVDEPQRFLHLPTSLEDALGRSRSLGVGWHLAHQSRSQLSKGLREAIDANARNNIVFGLAGQDASQVAKLSNELTAEDFRSLGRYEAYIRPVINGHPADWCSARTLPPTPAISDPAEIRRYCAPRHLDHDATPERASGGEPDANPTPVGRIRRQS